MISLSVNALDTPAKMRTFGSTYNVPFTLGLDTNTTFQQQYPVPDTPRMYLFNQNGALLKYWFGYTPYATLANDINVIFGISSTTYTTSSASVPGGGNPQTDWLSLLFGNIFVQFFGSAILVLLIYVKLNGSGTKEVVKKAE